LPEGSSKPDHCIVIKYLPYVGDSKRAMDEYVFQIFMGGQQTVVMHNTCEDSLLAAPLILDLCILTELSQRLEISTDGGKTFERMRSVLSILSYLLKAPFVPAGTPAINALNRQKQCIENLLRALVGHDREPGRHACSGQVLGSTRPGRLRSGRPNSGCCQSSMERWYR